MKTRMVNRIVNKYLLHNRSIQFKSEDEFNSFMERRKILIERNISNLQL